MTGYPTMVIAGIAKQLALNRRAICDAINFPQPHGQIPFYSSLLQMLVILGRFPRNRAALRRNDVQLNIVAIASASVAQLQTLAGGGPIQDTPFAVHVLTWSLEYILALLDAGGRARHVSTPKRPRDDVIFDSSLLTAIADALKCIRSFPHDVQMQLWHHAVQEVTLNTICAICSHSDQSRDTLRELGVIELLADLLDPASFPTAEGAGELARQFSVHVLSVHALREFCANANCVRHAEMLRVFDRLLELQLWTTTTFDHPYDWPVPPQTQQFVDVMPELQKRLSVRFTMSVVDMPKDIIDREHEHPELALLFQQICEFCLNNAESVEAILRSLARLIMRAHADLVSPVLRLYIVDMFVRLLTTSPNIVENFHKAGIWEAILCDSFIGSGRPGAAKIRGIAVDVLASAATLTTRDSQVFCIQALLTVLRDRTDAAVVAAVADALRLILHANVHVTQQSLLIGGVLPTLARCLTEHAHWTESTDASEPVARAAELALMDSLLTVPELQMPSLTCGPLMQALFGLLEQKQLAEFALKRVAHLMESAVRLNDGKLDLYTKYLEAFPRAMIEVQRGSEKHFALLLQLLKSMRVLLTKHTKAQQSTLRNAGCFIQVVTLLNAEHSFDKALLCESVLHTLTALMSGNSKSKLHFNEHINYDLLAHLIQNNVKPLSSHTFAMLLDMLVDGGFSLHTNYIIRNADVVGLIFNLFPHCAADLQQEIIDTFLNICNLCTRNRAHCSHALVLERLLAILPSTSENVLQSKMLKLIQLLGGHNITVKALKSLFRLLTSVESVYRPRLWSPLLHVLQNIARKVGPRCYFDFDGQRSYLTLPPLPQWPQNSGYSFSTWFRAESLTLRSPRLFSFYTSKAQGVELLFEDGHLVIRVITLNKVKQHDVKFEFEFSEQRWYCITLVHMGTKLLWSESDVQLYVDGELVNRKPTKLKYPAFDEPMAHCRIGAAAGSLSNTSLFGQLGAIYFFNDALTASQARAVYQLGADYAYTFLPTNVGLAGDQQPQILDGSLSSKIFLTYNSMSCDGKLCLDNTLENTMFVREPLHATMHAIQQCITRNVKEVIHCLGGVRVLFPLFAQLDQPLQPPADATDPVVYAADPAMCNQLLGLLHDMLQGSSTNIESMRKRNGFGVISYLLQQLSPQHISWQAIPIIGRLIECVTAAMNATTGASLLLEDLMLHFLLDFRLWIYTAPEVQSKLLTLIAEQVARNPKWFRDGIGFGVQEWLDVLRMFYWFEPDSASQAQLPAIHPVTKQTTGQRPSGDDLTQMRLQIFQIMQTLAKDDVRMPDVQAVVYCLADCRDDRHLGDVLQFFYGLISLTNGGVWDLMRGLGELSVFTSLLDRPLERVRVLSMKCIGKLLALAPRAHRAAKELNKYGLDSITRFPFTEVTYGALMMVLLEDPREGTEISVDVDDEQQFKNPGILNTIFALLPTASLFWKQKVLQDLILLITNSSSNRLAVIQQFGWQNWLFTQLVECKQRTEEAEVVFELVMTIFKLLLYHLFKHDESGFRVIEETLGQLELFPRREEMDVPHVTRHIFANLLSCLQSELIHQSRLRAGAQLNQFFWIEYFAQSKAVPVLSNLVHVLNLIEDFVFYSPMFALPPVVADAPLSPMQSGSVSLEGTPQMTAPIAAAISQSPPMFESPLSPRSAASVPRTLSVTSDEDEESVPAELVSITMHRRADGRWADLQLVEVVLQTLDMLGFTTMPDFSQMEQLILEGKIFIVMTNLRGGGVPRIVLRLIVTSLQQGDEKACSTNVRRLTTFLRTYLDDSGDMADNRRLFSVLSVLLQTLRDSVDRTTAAGGPSTHDIVAPVLAQLLKRRRALLSTVLRVDTGFPLLGQDSTWLRDSASIAELVDVVTSPEWRAIAMQVLDPEACVQELEEADFAAKVAVKWRKGLRELKRRCITERAEQHDASQHIRQLDSDFCEMQVAPQETQRLTTALTKLIDLARSSARTWRTVLRSVQGQRGAWGGDDESEVHYKLDKTEDDSRRRLRLKRNYDFNPHIGCALHTGRESDDEDEHVESEPRQAPPVAVAGIKIGAIGALKSEQEEPMAMIEEDDATRAAQAMSAVEQRLYHSDDCELVSPMSVVKGRLEITTRSISFRPLSEQGTDRQLNDIKRDTSITFKEHKWALADLQELHMRRFLLRRSALELFLVDKTNYFLNFASTTERNQVYRIVVQQRPPNLASASYGSVTPAELLRRLKLTERWQKRQISNFDYLMALNTIAGRTYNDLTQYPVFPWVLTDYISDEIDLNNPRVYRNLAKPIGALNEKRLAQFQERYDAFDDPVIPKFYYGTHYSSSAIVLFYNIRMEPFTTMFLKLQGGKFDHADRMFGSIPLAWSNVLNSSTDVKQSSFTCQNS
eukprot:TRINITY_DN1378_c0_g1_i1.p1 TRINITY_DN1378_c0_g1~~TRINITY_DN1378_c0_g1_i1.p1  ORF type:complete len:2456 (-),score=520.26 TRINITY_DN1378_c0_g1_i1:2419-9516(-)